MQLPAAPVILGCGTFGGIGGARQLIGKGLSETAAEETLDEAVRLGVLWWDTAERYADGASERVIGTWLSGRPRELADRIHIATKVAPASLTGDRDQRFDSKYIESKLRPSVRQMVLRSRSPSGGSIVATTPTPAEHSDFSGLLNKLVDRDDDWAQTF